MSSTYQTFEGRPLIRHHHHHNETEGEEVRALATTGGNGRFMSCARRLFFAAFFIFIAIVALGPITFVVALIRVKLFPDPDMVTTPPPTFRSERKTFLLHMEPTEVSYPEAGPNCSYHVYTYGGTVPGPAVVVDPGMSFNVEVINTFGPDLKNSTRHTNQYQMANSSTTHFHGLHVSPAGKADNVYALVAPGESRTYTINLREDHPSGTYFIHPHLHGSTSLQVGFAMSSPLIIRDLEQWWRSLPEDVFVVQRGGLGSGHGSGDARLAFQQNEGPTQPAESFCSPQEFVLLNGQIGTRATICDELIRRWRIINAATDGALILKLKGDKGCRARLIARDGIYLAEGVPKVVRSSDIFVVPPGGRIDFLVQQLPISKTCELVSESQQRIVNSLGPKTKIILSGIAKCVAAAENQTFPSLTEEELQLRRAFPKTLPALPSFMDDLRAYPKAERRILEWTEFSQTFRNGDAKYGINGEAYSHLARFSVRLDRIQEWVIINALAADQGPAVESHPFHLHTNHFQIIGSEGNTLNNEDYAVGQWRDTVYVPTPGNLTIRWIPRHYTGKSLVHCEFANQRDILLIGTNILHLGHILSHEDLGMSWAFDIVEHI